jgi:hypothetical protein
LRPHPKQHDRHQGQNAKKQKQNCFELH